MILEPIYEADFSPYSFGFRPNRCTMDAIECITWSTQDSKKYFWVIEGDISSYFDTIHHRVLVHILRQRIKDTKILRLIWKFLRAGIMEGHLFQDTRLGISQGGIVSPLLANVYLNQLNRHIHERYTGFSRKEKTKRRQQGLANFVYLRYADDFVLLSNGTKEQVQEVKRELHHFLKTNLKLTLSLEKTSITHLNDGFQFLGFRIQRKMGSSGMRTHVLIPEGAVKTIIGKVETITNRTTTQNSANSTMLALNQTLGGWSRYYRYTSRASKTFAQIGYQVFWRMAHWLGRKYRLSMSEVMRRYRQGNTLATHQYHLIRATDFPTLRYRKRFFSSNPYTTQEIKLQREDLSVETYWSGRESRSGMADLRPVILQRDHFTCQLCDRGPLPSSQLQVDHLRPVRRFKSPVDANTPLNLWTLCIPCHKEKTKSDRQMESPLPGNRYGGFGEGDGGQRAI